MTAQAYLYNSNVHSVGGILKQLVNLPHMQVC